MFSKSSTRFIVKIKVIKQIFDRRQSKTLFLLLRSFFQLNRKLRVKKLFPSISFDLKKFEFKVERKLCQGRTVQFDNEHYSLTTFSQIGDVHK
jgi:hypothetical protein